MDATFNEVIDNKGDGLCLFDHLKNRFPYIDTDCWEHFIATGEIELDGQPVSDNPPLRTGQRLRYCITGYSEPPVDTRWQLLWQNDEILALHKPASLPVSRTTRNIYNCLIELVRRESPWPDAHLLHRLDLETAGIILLGKTKADAARWQPKLKQLLARKIYRAVVYGQPHWQGEGQSHRCTLALTTKKESPIRCQMHADPAGKASETRFRLLSSNGYFSIIECELITGRKHQIRAHLAALGHPIVGDKIYSNSGEYYLKRLADAHTEADREKLLSPHHLLFAQRVALQLSDDPTAPRQWIENPHYPEAWQHFCSKQQL